MPKKTVYGRNLKMSKKGTYSHVNYFYDFPRLVQRLRISRRNYDFPTKSLSSFVGCWFILETFVDPVKTSHGERVMLIISELSDPDDPESEPTGKRFKVFSSSQRINEFLRDLRVTEEELDCLPMALRLIAVPFFDKKGNQTKTRYEFDTGL